MGIVNSQISVSLDGYVAGPNPSVREPLGERGEELHEWAFATEAWQRQHGREGGERGPDSDVVARLTDGVGAYVMGRGMFGGGPGPWDESWTGWWGPNPPYHVPVFVLTHHPREPLEMEGGTTFHFVTDGIESAVAQAREAAGERIVHVAGGAQAIQQALRAGLLEELHLHIPPLLLGGGTRLFEDVGTPRLELVETVASPVVTHVRYRVAR